VRAGGEVAQALAAFQTLLGPSTMLAYLSMMAPRLIELHRVLRSTGALYLHCDPTASHYLRLLLDAIFGPAHFRNEIIWKRTPFSGSSKARAAQLPRSHDVVLLYSKGHEWTWNGPTEPYSEDYLKRFKWDDDDGRGRYRKTLLKTYSKETFERLRDDDRLVAPVREGAQWSYKQYLSESSGQRQIDDVWTDVNALNPVARERLGYPTQKPEALLERIISASTAEGVGAA
jgi:adenine specific DNA methylase Mod